MGKLQVNGDISFTGAITTPGNDTVVIKPAQNNYDQIGASDCKFWKVHATTFYGNLSGNADTATKLATARTISLTGSVTGSGSFDGSGNLSISTTTNHTHSYLPLSGGTLTGNLTMDSTKTIVLRAAEAWRAGIGYDTQGNECIALWAKNTATSLRWYAGKDMSTMTANTMMGITPDFEISKASGTATGYIGGNTILHSGNYTSYAAKRLAVVGSIGASSDTHASALQSYFNSNKSSIPKDELSTYYSSAYGNGSMYMGYFLRNYDSTPYGGFYVAHYNTPYYVGILYGSYNQQQILTSTNYSSFCASASHSHSSIPSYAEYSSTSSLDGFLTDGVLRWAKVNSAALAFGNDGSVISVGWGGGYGSQVWLDDGSGPAKMAVRNRSGGSSWNGWRHCIMSCSETYYGGSLPSSGNVGDVFFKT